jgi:FKBP-type peptidyl-prolyl cis-trans isomerase
MKYFTPLLLLVTFISCNSDDSIESLNQTEADIIQYIESNNLNAQKTNSGVYYIIEEQGTGKKPTSDAYVTLKYNGYLLDGTVFDLSKEEGITLDLLAVIPGFAEGITYFNEGSKGTILIPPSLAYGNYGASNVIPGGAVVIFDIEVISVLNAQNEDDILEYLSNNNLEAERTESGVYYIIDSLGEGNVITENSSVTVKYTATLTNGVQFDKSGEAGSHFYLQNVIPGFAEGISLFKKGGKGKLIIPPHLAYGSNGVPNAVPRNAIVIFDFEIL